MAPPNNSKLHNFLLPALILFLAAIVTIYWDSLTWMINDWETKEEYSHGYMIPLVALFLLWQRLPSVAGMTGRANWISIVLLVVALLGWLLGDLSSLFIITHYSFLLVVVSLFVALFGINGSVRLWPALVYLLFMIPLPVFIYNGLSQELQLISSQLGVWVVRLFGISVFLEGNVIDLGVYQLQVVEACSGLRYLFPLMSFGFLIAVVYKGPTWHKWIIFLSTIPVTVLMNSFRIGVIGITVEYWGIEMAEGFLHDFEGWFVFMACLGVLVLVILLLNILAKDGVALLDRIDLSYPTISEVRESGVLGTVGSSPALMFITLISLAAVPASFLVKDRLEVNVERSEFSQFPLLRGEWIGRESALSADVLNTLRLTDYIKANYRQGSQGIPVNFYVAYYDSQRKGSSIHSPRSCIPGGGWEISNLSEKYMGEIQGAEGLTVNRLIIQKGEYKQLTYYWFAQRGRVITNEYLAKWYLFHDGITMNRTDGSLVRLVTPIPPGTEVADADDRLQQFIKDFYPILPRYLPGN